MLLMNGKQIEGAIFDIDGTLVDSFSAFTSAFNNGTNRFHLEPVSKQFLTHFLRKGLNLPEILGKIFPLHTAGPLIERCQRDILEHFLRIEVGEVKPFRGIDRLFGVLHDRGIRIGIATGRASTPENEWIRFKRFGLERFIDSIVTSREVPKRKPAPDVIIECAKKLGIPVENCLAVGDTEADIIAGRRAGGMPVAILTAEDRLDLLESEKPEFIFESLNEFASFLEEQGKRGRDSVREGGKH
jgi:HAD superfamily hydrolase (TIGR01549 family)